MINKAKYTIDELKNGGEELFEEIKKSYEHQYNTVWKSLDEDRFGKNLHKSLEFVGFQILPLEQTTFNQIHRANTKNPKHDQISKSILHGFKVGKVPPCVIEVPGNKPEFITGNTRTMIFIENDIPYIVVAVYKYKDEFVGDRFAREEALIEMGQTFQEKDAYAPTCIADIKFSVSRLIDLYKKSEGKSGIDFDIGVIHQKVNELSGSTFKPKKMFEISYAIFNTHNPDNVIAGWSVSKGAEFNPHHQKWYDTFKMIDTKNVIYLVSCASQAKHIYLKAKEKLLEKPDAEVRLVLFPSPLDSQTSYDFENSFENQISTWINEYKSYKNVDLGLFKESGTEVLNRLRFYGVYPTIFNIHAQHELLLFHEKKEILYQKSNDYTLELKID